MAAKVLPERPSDTSKTNFLTVFPIKQAPTNICSILGRNERTGFTGVITAGKTFLLATSWKPRTHSLACGLRVWLLFSGHGIVPLTFKPRSPWFLHACTQPHGLHPALRHGAPACRGGWASSVSLGLCCLLPLCFSRSSSLSDPARLTWPHSARPSRALSSARMLVTEVSIHLPQSPLRYRGHRTAGLVPPSSHRWGI